MCVVCGIAWAALDEMKPILDRHAETLCALVVDKPGEAFGDRELCVARRPILMRMIGAEMGPLDQLLELVISKPHPRDDRSGLND